MGVSPVAPLNYWKLSTSFLRPKTQVIYCIIQHPHFCQTHVAHIYLIAIIIDRVNNFQQVV